LNNSTINVAFGSILAWRLKTMPALVWEEIPVELTLVGKLLPESYNLEGTEGEIWRILVATPIKGLGGRQSVPFFAGYLAASAGRTFSCVYEKRFVSHTALTSF
jgi:hypothetical protein